MKKFISILLCMAMVLTVFAGSGIYAFADTDGDYEYRVLDDGTVEITGYNSSEDGDIEIPHTINGRDVSSVGEAAFYLKQNIGSVTFSSSVKNIGQGAFSSCSNLQYVSFSDPDSIETIGDNAFLGCTSLKSISLGKNASGITTSTFMNCPKVTSYQVSSENKNYSSENGVLFNKNKTELLYYPSGSSNTSYTVPDGVTKIKENSFYAAKSLKEITLPLSLSEIEQNAFRDPAIVTVNILAFSLNGIKYGSDFNGLLSKAEVKHIHTPVYVPSLAPTCTDPGLTDGTRCSVCGEFIRAQRSVPAKGHTRVTLAAVAPTFTKSGLTSGVYCPVCNTVLISQKNVKKLALPKLKKLKKGKKSFTAKWKKVKGVSGYQIQYSLKKNMKSSKKKTVKPSKTSVKVAKLKKGKKYYVRIRAYTVVNNKKVYSKWSSKKTVKVK